jgi:hypothetical protein
MKQAIGLGREDARWFPTGIFPHLTLVQEGHF